MPFGNPSLPATRSLEAVINGDCRVCQQNIVNGFNTSIVVAINGSAVTYNCVDMFALQHEAPGGPFNVNSAQIAQHPLLGVNGFSIRTSGLPNLATAGTASFVTRCTFVELLDFEQLLEQQCVLQFWARSQLHTGNHYCTLDVGQTGIAGEKFIARFNIRQLNTWEQFFIPVTFSDANLTLPAPESRVRILGIHWPLVVGTLRQSANPAFINSWLGATGVIAANDTPQYGASGSFFDVTDVSIVPGIGKPSFARLPFNDVLQRVKRYYQQTFPYGVRPSQVIGAGAGGSAADGRLKYPALIAAATRHAVPVNFEVEMMNAPVVTFYNPEALNANWRNETLAADSGAPAADQLSAKNATIANPQVAGDAVGNVLTLHASFDARMT